MSILGDAPAFPVLPPLDCHGDSPAGYPFPSSGVTIHQYFAAKAMQALIMRGDYLVGMDQPSKYQQVAQEANKYASRMVQVYEK